jgi:two-component system chemotaxis sensor kinase CheA
MEDFTAKFKEEAIDLMNDLESALLVLEAHPEDKAQVSLIFRAMHSLKGTGSMFGFDKISSFTHNLETIYDFIKEDKIIVNQEIINLTLSSVDVIKSLLEDDSKVNSEINNLYNEISKKIIDLISSTDKEWENKPKIQQIITTKTELDKISTYFISFIPNENIFRNGTNPLYLLDELACMGDSIVIPHIDSIPELISYSPSMCYTWWEILLATNQSLDDIKNVFIFVEDDCQLEINFISSLNLLADKDFKTKFINKPPEKKVKGFDQTKAFIELFNKEKEKKHINITIPKVNIKESNISSIRVSTDKLDDLLKLVSEMITVQSRLSSYSEIVKEPELINISENIAKLTRQLRDNAYKISLIPINTMLIRFQRLVRDLSVELNKEVSFESIGGETELDKKIVEYITDPILHILRNSLDHGIEDKESRIKKGKSERGKIRLKAYYSGANVIIQIKDDGKGIDPDVIKNKAIEKGIIAPNTILGKRDIFNLIFHPGLSTASLITDVSGRGVGMDVVRRNINDIRGEVEIDSVLDKSTTITLKLPLTLSIIDGLLVKVADTIFVIPLNSIYKIYAVHLKMIENNFYNLIALDGKQISYFHLKEEFNLPNKSTKQILHAIVVFFEDKLIALIADNVIGEYQAVVKPLGKLYNFQEIISGATILGDGTLALVMDTNKIINKFSNQINNKIKGE